MTREPFFQAVGFAEPVLVSTAVRERWGQPSRLEHMTIGDVAAHLVRAVSTVATYARGEPGEGTPLTAPQYFVSVVDDPSDVSSPTNVAVRERSSESSSRGPAAVLSDWRNAVATVEEILGSIPHDRLVTVAGDVVLPLDEYLVTRIVELVIHTDDLAQSIDIETPDLPPLVAEIVGNCLLQVAQIRHGNWPVLRAFARRERHPGSVAAF